MRRTMGRARLSLAMACLLVSGSKAWGQATTATFVGSVTDNSGAAVPNADIELTDQGTGQHYTAETNETGNYEFTCCPRAATPSGSPTRAFRRPCAKT